MTDYSFLSVYYEDQKYHKVYEVSESSTALLIIDLQNTYTKLGKTADTKRFTNFSQRLENVVIPNTKKLLFEFRKRKMQVIYCRIASHLKNGNDRSLSQKLEGWNSTLLFKDDYDSQIIDSIAPQNEEIVLTKTTDSALTGTNLRLILNNLSIKTVVCAGIFTDQCVSSTVRSLSDESFDVIVPHDATAAGTMELHNAELTILNHIYCTVMSSNKIIDLLK